MTINFSLKSSEFLRLANYEVTEEDYKLRFFLESFHYHDGKKWIRLDGNVFYRQLVRFSQNNPQFLPDTKGTTLNNLVLNLQTRCELLNYIPGLFVGEGFNPDVTYIPMNNGVLKLDHCQKDLSIQLLGHSHRFMSTHTLPYDYEPESKCPIFLNFINEIMSPEEVFLLQEWLGYCLTTRTDLEAMMFLVGQGANGKSVLLLVIRLLVGKFNVSSVRLEDLFSDQYSVIETEGKLINMAEEIAKDRKISATGLKDFTSGAYFYAKQKYRTAYLFKVTAKAMFACNHLPSLDDDTDGTVRRLLVISLEKQFLDPLKQNTNYKREDFWIGTGELPGIFNWALQGLQRVIKNNNKFTIPKKVKDAVSAYDYDINPFKHFLQDTVTIDPTGEISTRELYRLYKNFCREFNYKLENGTTFTKNVKKFFYPSVGVTKNAKWRNNERSHLFEGIRFIKEDPLEESTAKLSSVLKNTSGMATLAQLTHSLATSNLRSAKVDK